MRNKSLTYASPFTMGSQRTSAGLVSARWAASARDGGAHAQTAQAAAGHTGPGFEFGRGTGGVGEIVLDREVLESAVAVAIPPVVEPQHPESFRAQHARPLDQEPVRIGALFPEGCAEQPGGFVVGTTLRLV